MRRSYLSIATVLPLLFCIGAFFCVFYFWPVLTEYTSERLYFALIGSVVVLLTVLLRSYLKYHERLFRKVGNAHLPDSQQLYEELFLNSPTPYILATTGGKVITPNLAAIRIFGVVEGALDGKNLFDFLAAENESHLSLIPAKIEKGIYINDEEVRILRPDGTFKWAFLSGFPIEGFGRKQFALITLVDITRQKQIDQVKTEFVSLASHQLRTPISSLKWNIELLTSERTGTLNEKQQKYTEKIERAAERMDALVADFLNVSKLELGTFAPRAKQLDIKMQFESIFDEFIEKIESKGLQVLTNYDESIPTMVVDKRLFRMVMSNLISNAVKYTPNGGTVTVGYSGNNRRITFTIADTGMGVPKADQEMLFTKLFRAKNAREQVPDGTGLGLYVVKQAVEVMKGEISFVSKENEGTTFEVVLPR